MKQFKKQCKNDTKLFDAELSSVRNKAEAKKRKEEFEIELAEKVSHSHAYVQPAFTKRAARIQGVRVVVPMS